jgi:hypothetical protein
VCILEPSERGQQPPIQRALEGRQPCAAEFSRVDTAWLPHIIAETHSQEYNVYFRAMRQRLAALIHKVLKGQPVFRS